MKDILALVVGKDVEVEYEGGSGEMIKVKGKLISTDTGGYVILEKEGKKKLINKDKVHSITEI
jgi:hypothetical protein